MAPGYVLLLLLSQNKGPESRRALCDCMGRVRQPSPRSVSPELDGHSRIPFFTNGFLPFESAKALP